MTLLKIEIPKILTYTTMTFNPPNEDHTGKMY